MMMPPPTPNAPERNPPTRPVASNASTRRTVTVPDPICPDQHGRAYHRGWQGCSCCSACVPLLALAACANPELPAEPTPAEVRQVVLDLETEQWFTMFGEQREPQTLVRVWMDSFAEQKAAVDECMAATTAPDRDLVQWLCFKRYPVSPDSPDLDFILTKAQADYLYDYYVERLIPCLESIGMTVGEAPRRVEFTRLPYGALSWSPYARHVAATRGDAGWQWVISQCGTPPYADRTHPMPNDDAPAPGRPGRNGVAGQGDRGSSAGVGAAVAGRSHARRRAAARRRGSRGPVAGDAGLPAGRCTSRGWRSAPTRAGSCSLQRGLHQRRGAPGAVDLPPAVSRWSRTSFAP